MDMPPRPNLATATGQDRGAGRRDGKRRQGVGGRAAAALLVAIVALPVLVLGASAWLAWQETWRGAARELDQTAEAVAQFGLRTLSAHAMAAGRVDAVLRGLTDAEIRAREPELHLELKSLVAELPQAEASYVIDRAGRALVSANILPMPREAAVAADREFFVALRGEDAPAVHVSQVYNSRFDGLLFFAVSRRRTLTGNADVPPGGFDGLVNLSVYPNQVAAQLRQLAIRDGDVLTLVRADGEMLARSIGQTGPVRIPPGTRFIENAAAGVERARYEALSRVDGVTQLISMRRVEGWPVYATANRPRAAIVQAWRDQVATQLAIGLPATLGLAGLALLVWRGQARLGAANASLERRVAERTEALGRSEARYRALVEVSPQVVWTTDSARRLTYASAAWWAITGQAEAETLEGHGWLRAMHPDDAGPMLAAWHAAGAGLEAGGSGLFETEFRLRRAQDGAWRWFLARWVPELDAAGRIARWLGAGFDIDDRKLAEAGLRESEATLSAVLDALPVGVVIADAGGRIVRDNAAHRALWGMPPETTDWSQYGDWVGYWPETGARIGAAEWALSRALLRGEVVRGELVESEQFGTGERRFYLNNAAPIRDREGTIVAGVVAEQDVTERRAIELSLARSEERLRLALEAGRMGIFDWDLRADGLTWDARLFELFGMDAAAGQPDGAAAMARVHAEDLAGLKAAIREALGSGGVFSHEFRVVLPDGSARWLGGYGRAVQDASGQAVRMVGLNFDITPRREAEAALRRSEGWLRMATEGAGVGTWEVDLPTGAGQWSAQAVTLLGGGSAAFGMEDRYAELHPDDREGAAAAWRQAEETDASYEVEARTRRPAPDGGERWLLWRGRVERDSAGRAVRGAGIVLDVTARRRAEQRLMLLAREVDHRAKNALAVVQATVRLSPRDDAAAFAAAVEGRIAALARAQVLLADGGWQGAELGAVAEGALAAFLDGGRPEMATPTAVLDGPAVRLAPAATQPLTLALHELATNAVKYGALSAPAGRLGLHWSVDAARDVLRLRWTESGGPAIETPPTRRGFGTRVLQATIRDQLGGRVERRWDPAGLTCEMELPLPRVLAHDGMAAPLLG